MSGQAVCLSAIFMPKGGSHVGKAIYYLLEQWPYLTRYLDDGRLELSNNRAERSIKPFVMGRKNWLFANTPGGQQRDLQPDRNGEGERLGSVPLSAAGTADWPQLSEEDAAWVEKLLPANAPKECYMPEK